MKKLILNSNSNLILYLPAILLICVLVGLSSLDFYSGEQYGYWYFNNILR